MGHADFEETQSVKPRTVYEQARFCYRARNRHLIVAGSKGSTTANVTVPADGWYFGSTAQREREVPRWFGENYNEWKLEVVYERKRNWLSGGEDAILQSAVSFCAWGSHFFLSAVEKRCEVLHNDVWLAFHFCSQIPRP